MSLKSDDFSIHVGIPNKDLKVKSTADNYLMSFTVSYFSHSTLMTLENTNRICRHFIIEYVFIELDILEMFLYFVLLRLSEIDLSIVFNLPL